MKEWAKAIAKLLWLGFVLLCVGAVAVTMVVEVFPSMILNPARCGG